MYVSILPMLTLALAAQSTAKSFQASSNPQVGCKRKSIATSSNVYLAIQNLCSKPTFDLASDYALKGAVLGGPMGSVNVFVARQGQCGAGSQMPQEMCKQLFYTVCNGGDAMGFGTYPKLPNSCYVPTIKGH